MGQRKKRRHARQQPSDRLQARGKASHRPKRLTRIVVLLAVALIGAASFTVSSWFTAPGYDVVVVVVDTLRRDGLGCYGNHHNTSPNIDAIAADGVRFDLAISTSGWTLPAIGSLMTGAWPTIHGGLGKPDRLRPLREETPSMTTVLKEHGYDTYGFANAAFVSPMLGFDRDFDVFDHWHGSNAEIRRADKTIDDALGVIRTRRSRRGFVFIHLFDPHLDYDPPSSFARKYTDGRTEPQTPLTMQMCADMLRLRELRPDGGRFAPTPEDIAYLRGVYQGEVNFADAQLGRLVSELKRSGAYDRTLLIVTSDHGEEFWEHRAFEHGHTLYDELVRIPLIVKLPADITPVKKVVAEQVRIVDIAPTVFGLLEIDQPASFVGETLTPLMMGEGTGDRIAFCESTLWGEGKLAWRGERYKYIVDVAPDGKGRAELYDWRADPGETKNLIATCPDVADALRVDLMSFYGRLTDQAQMLSNPEARNMSPAEIARLKGLGYIR